MIQTVDVLICDHCGKALQTPFWLINHFLWAEWSPTVSPVAVVPTKPEEQNARCLIHWALNAGWVVRDDGRGHCPSCLALFQSGGSLVADDLPQHAKHWKPGDN